ncbi:ABC transporter permease [Actinomadura roseirufa]|uniref:ABC transporter permease n=1 Tax=Actinomadura roseirufa TaxID=2094049 RepID=UPI001040E9C1|nr:ABC transporter permease [Actinomadura roseirufa]
MSPAREPVPRPVSWPGSRLVTQIDALTGRSLRALVLDPRVLATSLLAPFLMLAMFSQVFSGMTAGSHFPEGIGYIDFLAPAIMVNTSLQSGMLAGTNLSDEMRNGIVARFKVMPIWPGSVLIGRSLAELIRSLLRLTVLLLAALALFGFRPGGGVAGVIAGAGVAVVLGWGLGWIFIAIACWLRGAELIQNVSGAMLFPLMFASNAFAPVEGLPGWLSLIARINPMTYGIDAVRDLTLRGAAGLDAVIAVTASLSIAVVSLFVAERGFSRIH